MRSLKRLFRVHLFYAFIIMFITMIFVLNLSFFIFANIHYSREIKRQYDNLSLMVAHLSREDNLDLTAAYLEHYTHNAQVILTFYSDEDVLIYTNDQEGILTDYDDVYDDDRYVGRLSISYVTSSFGQEYVLGFILINVSSLVIFFVGSYGIRKYLISNYLIIESDLDHIEDPSREMHFQKMNEIKDTIIHEKEEVAQRERIYASHIKRLAHDVKTPLTASKIYMDGLINGRIPYDKHVLKDVQQELERIEHIIPQFIEMDQNKLPYLHDVSKEIERYVHRYQAIFDTKSIRVELNLEPLLVLISEHDMITMIEHLLLNSFYYSNPDKVIKIQTLSDERQIIIHDQGIGMTEETIQQLMKGPFRAIEGMKYHTKGSGMGYQIIDDILKNMHGSIKIESQLEQGTKVMIQCPPLA